MISNPSILAIIPARGGSKGLPGKNVLDLCGKPTIAWTIEACLNFSLVSKVIVSSDDEGILKASERYGAETIVRPAELATDSALVVPVVDHVLNKLKDQLSSFKYLVLAQPTSPLRTSVHLQEAFELLIKNGGDSVISVVESDRTMLKSFLLNGGFLQGIHNDEYPFLRRQDLPVVYKPNGAIYIIEIEKFLSSNSLMTKKTIPYVMPEEDSMDIDVIEDFTCVENILKKRK